MIKFDYLAVFFEILGIFIREFFFFLSVIEEIFVVFTWHIRETVTDEYDS